MGRTRSMGWQFTAWVVPLAVVGGASLALFLYTLRYRRTRIAIPLLGVLLCTSLWTAGDVLRLLTTTRHQKLLGDNVGFVGIAFVGLAMFTLVLEFVDRRDWLTRRRLAVLLVVPISTIVFAFVDVGNAFRRSVGIADITLPVTNETVRYLTVEYGPMFDLLVLYSYGLLVLGGLLLLGRVADRDESSQFRVQSLTLFVALLFPTLLNLPYVLGILPLDFTSFAFSVTALFVTVAVFRFRLLDLKPIARSTVVENLDSGVLVATPEDRVVDVNERAAAILDVPERHLIGVDLAAALYERPAVEEPAGTGPEDGDRLTLHRDGDRRHLELEVSPVTDGSHVAGRVVMVHDVTEEVAIRRELERQREDLERQNERLSDFARIVTHDLRNPLNVARGRVDLAQTGTAGDEGDEGDEHLDLAIEAIDRVTELVDDVRTFALQGQAVGDREPVRLHDVATEAWRTVETGDATLEIETDDAVGADPARLRQLFENLLRNAVDHGPPDVTVRIGATDDGFYVADDGPGIPEADRSDVLDDGYTTLADGTGLGLSIVRAIAEAHGWDVVVSESETGGARFEFRGVDVPGIQVSPTV